MPPTNTGTTSYSEGHELTKAEMKSSSTWYAWMKNCRGAGIIIDKDEKLAKAPNLPQVEWPGVLATSPVA